MKQSIIVVSSANNLIFNFKSVAKSFIYLREKRGPKIDPCDTRSRIHSQSEVFPIRVTLWTLSLKRFLINLSRFPLTPFCFNLNNTILYRKLLIRLRILRGFQRRTRVKIKKNVMCNCK